MLCYRDRKRVRAKCFVDATGNSDVAAAAGAETAFLSAREFALQSAGQAPHRIGRGGINSDFGFVNDSSAYDLWLFGLRARAGAPDAWDIAKMPDSRERRRIVPDYAVNAQDVTARRPFPDVVVQARSRQDSHGYLTDDFRFLSTPSAKLYQEGERRWKYDVNVPLRSLLPKGLKGLAVIGIGSGCARDVLPMVRMQADLMNMGYAVGLAAAQAARQNGDFRKLDWTRLRAALVKEGILREEVLDWNEDVDITSESLIRAAVLAVRKDFAQSHVLYRPENRARALPLLRRAYGAETEESARQVYALLLGLMGDATGAATLAAVVTGKLPISVPQSRPAAFGGGTSDLTAFMIALGRSKDESARDPLLAKLRSVKRPLSMVGFRPYCIAAAELGDPALAPELERFLDLPGVSGHAVRDWKTLSPTGGYGHGSVEYDDAVRELGIVRALVACGDPTGRGRKTLEDYVRDPRGVLSAHARAILLEIR